MEMWVWIVIIAAIAVVAVSAVAALGWLQQQRRSTDELREGFGPEYDRAVDQFGSRKAAESELRERQDRVSQLELQPLPQGERSRFQERWTATQARFVDEPAAAIGEANSLVDGAMKARGYPVADGDFDERAADITVDHPYVVENYRAARRIALANDSGEATTEDLRQGMMHYRALFNDLLTAGTEAPESPEIRAMGEVAAPGRASDKAKRRSDGMQGAPSR